MVFSDGLGFDYSYASPPVISDSQLDVYLNGTFYGSKFGEKYPYSTFDDLKINLASKNLLQTDVSVNTVNSLMLTLFETSKFNLTITNEMLPETSPIQLTTTFLEGLLPGLVETFGDDKPMSVNVKAHTVPVMSFTQDVIGANIELAVDF